MDLDTRARTAASSLRHSVGALEPVAGSHPPASRGWPLALAVAALVIAVVGALVALPGDERQVVATARSEIPALAPGGDVRQGEITELPDPSDDTVEHLRLHLGSDGGDLGVMRLDGDVAPLEEGALASVRGRPGRMATDPSGLRRLTWLEREGVLVLVASRSLDDAALLRVADELVLEGDAFEVPQVPAELKVAFDGRTAYVPGLGLSMPAGEGHVVSLDDPSVEITTLAGDGRVLTVLRWMAGGQQKSTTARGRPAALQVAGERSLLSWFDPGGFIVAVSATGVGDAELRSVAEALESSSAPAATTVPVATTATRPERTTTTVDLPPPGG